MRPAWRRLAERADKRAWAAEDVGEALCAAVQADFKREVSANLLTTLNGIIGASRQYTMFAEQGAEQLAQLRAVTPSGSFAESIIDYLDIALRGGRVGDAAWQEALQKACADRASEGSRQVEEHYKRKARPKAAESVRSRLQQGIQSPSFQTMAASLLAQDQSRTPRPAASKDRGLDAGPVLGE